MSAIDHLLARGVPLMPRPLVRRFAAPYIAGETLADAVETTRRLNAAGKRATIDVLGEEIDALGDAEAIRDAYIAVLDAISGNGLDGDVSVKPTGLGLNIDRAACRDLIGGIAEHAAAKGTTVEIDMEDSSTTTDILAVYHELRAEGHENLGIVLQAMLRRTPGDIDALASLAPRVRICKGIYVEPPAVALQGFDEVRAAWVAALERLLEIGAYPAIATHDAYLIEQATERVKAAGLTADAYEFQMLLGVRPGLGDELVRGGHPVRVYVPFGVRWYEYSVRRLRENPGLARSVARGTLARLVGRD
jgi:proline dehydrogenase